MYIVSISQNVSRSYSGVVLKVFWLILFPDRSPLPDFTRLLRTFNIFCKSCQIKSFETIKSHIWFILKIFILCDFFTCGQFSLKLTKNYKKWKWLYLSKSRSKMNLSGMIYTKNIKSTEKSSEVRTRLGPHKTSPDRI